MSKDGIVYLLMILNVNTYANVVLERFFRANESHIGVNESIERFSYDLEMFTCEQNANNKRTEI